MVDIQKLNRAMRDISAKKGDFTLFALFQREDVPDGWDLVVSSPWLEEGKLKALGEFAEALKSWIGEKQLRELSRIVTIRRDDPGLKAILSSIQVNNGMAEVRESVFFGFRVERAIFLRAKNAATHEIQTA